VTDTRDARSGLGRYVPRFASDWELDASDRAWQEIDGTLCFVDISGFTNLSERLAGRGRIGAEELTDVLSRAFGSMLELAYARGGALLKFGGDALLFLFSGDGHALQASSAAVEMRAALRESRQWRTSVGRLDLGMSIGIHSGTVHLFRVGGSHRELIITGPAATTTTRMEKSADTGEIVVSDATHAALPADAAVVAKDEGRLLRWRKVHAETVGPIERRGANSKALEANLSVALREHLGSGAVEPEHRIVTVGFVRFGGVDELLDTRGPAGVADGLHELVVATQRAVDPEDVTFLATDIDADGGKIILVAGAPAGRPDDEGRMLRAVRAIADAQLPFTVRIGVNRGHVFAGEVGTTHRATYTVMGDTVNLAARLMASAGPGQIYATRPVLDLSRTLFETTVLEPFHVKGKAEAVQAYAVGARGDDRAEELRTDLPFTGRTDELAELIDVLAVDRTSGTAITVIGEKGIGKSRLIEEALGTVPDIPRLLVRADAYRMTTPYYALRAPIRQLLDVGQDARDAAQKLGAALERLAPEQIGLAPLLADLVNVDLEPTPQTSAIEARFRPARLADLTAQLLRGLLPGRAAIVVEDAHWLDDASSGLLRHLEGDMVDHPWVLLVSRRDEPGGYVQTDATTIRLGPLDQSATHELVVEATEGAPLRPHTVDAIVDRTGGNPLFIEELLRAVRTSGDEADLPESLDDVVGAQIDALPPVARRLLQYASVLGRTFPRWLLDDVLAEDRMELDSASTHALETFLTPEGEELRFRHAVVRDAAYERLSFKRRRDIHLRAAWAVERRAGADPDSAADVLGLHFALGGETTRAWRYSRTAGDRARTAYANIEAGVHYARALQAARQDPDVPDADTAAVWTSLGEVQELAGLYRDALESFAHAMSLQGDDVIGHAALRLKRAQVIQRTGAFRSALREASASGKLIESEQTDLAASLRVQLLAFRAFVRQAQQRPVDALRQAQLVVVAAKAITERSALAGAYTVLDWAHLMLGRPSDPTFLPQALSIYEELGDLTSQGSVLNNLGGRAFYAGDWADAADLYQRARAAYLRSGDVVRAATAGANAGEILVAQAKLDDAAEILRESARTLRTAGVIEEAAFAETHLARTVAARGDLAAAERMLRDALAELQSVGSTMIALMTAVHVADVRLKQGEPSGALDTLGAAEAAAGDEAAILAPMTAHVRALALAELGRFEEASAVVADAIAVALEQGLVFEHARLVLAAADIARRTGAETDPDRVGSALADLRRLGVPTRPEDHAV
jgi:class 3 adenylate cyclase/tetratricopeptide (TPR) repeat protein